MASIEAAEPTPWASLGSERLSRHCVPRSHLCVAHAAAGVINAGVRTGAVRPDPELGLGMVRFARPVATVREVIRARAELHWESACAVASREGGTTERGCGSLFRDETRRDHVAAAAEKASPAGQF